MYMQIQVQEKKNAFFEFELPLSGNPDEKFNYVGQVNHRAENGPHDLLYTIDSNGSSISTQRDLPSKPFKKHSVTPLNKVILSYKKGDYVDVIADGAVQKGMSHKFYHGQFQQAETNESQNFILDLVLTYIYLSFGKVSEIKDDKKEIKEDEERALCPPPPVPDVRQPETKSKTPDDTGDDKSETAMTSHIRGVKSPVK